MFYFKAFDFIDEEFVVRIRFKNVNLDSIFTGDRKADKDIEIMLISKKMSKDANLAVNNGMLITPLTYGGEAWKWQKKYEN